MPTKIVIYGGVKEIGGNKILLIHEGSREGIFLDFGKSFERYSEYYEFFSHEPLSIEELVSLGIIPCDLRGLCSEKLDDAMKKYFNNLWKCMDEISPKEFRKRAKDHFEGYFSAPEGDKEPKLSDGISIVGVLISHAHADHVGHLSLLTRNPKAKIVMSDLSRTILEKRKELMDLWLWNKPSIDLIFSGILNNNKIIEFSKEGRISRFADFDVDVVFVDHSIPGASLYVIHSYDGPIVYTGDIRFGSGGLWANEKASKSVHDIVEKVKEYCDDRILCVITEATHVDFYPFKTESEVTNEIYNLVKMLSSEEIVFIYFSDTDIDRFNSVINAAKKLNAKVVLNYKHFYMLSNIAQRMMITQNGIKKILDPSTVYVLKEGHWKPIEEFIKKIEQRFQNYEFLKGGKIIDRLKKERLIWVVRSLTLKEARRINHIIKRKKKSGVFILSTSEPINEEQKIRFDKILHWFGNVGVPIYHIHASGHAHPIHLKKFIRELEPRCVIPIHTKEPYIFKRYVDPSNKYKWCIPEKYGESVRIS